MLETRGHRGEVSLEFHWSHRTQGQGARESLVPTGVPTQCDSRYRRVHRRLYRRLFRELRPRRFPDPEGRDHRASGTGTDEFDIEDTGVLLTWVTETEGSDTRDSGGRWRAEAPESERVQRSELESSVPSVVDWERVDGQSVNVSST